MHKSGQGNFAGASAAADLGTSLQDEHPKACLSQTNRRCQTVRPGTDYYCIIGFCVRQPNLRLTVTRQCLPPQPPASWTSTGSRTAGGTAVRFDRFSEANGIEGGWILNCFE